MKEYMIDAPKHLQEEMDGVHEYIKLSRMADAEGDHGYAALLRDMAREEYCHAKRWKEMVHETKAIPAPPNHDDLHNKWMELEAEMKDL